MKKILYCASTTGHLRSFHLPYLRILRGEGYAVTAAASGTAEGLPEGIGFVPVPFTKSFTSLNNLKASFRLAKLIRRERFDLILVHTSLAAFFTRLAVRLAGKGNTRVVNTVHGYLFGEHSSFRRRAVLLTAEKLMASVTDEILTMNEEDTRIAQKHRLCRGPVVQIDGMGVYRHPFHPAAPEEKKAARKALGLPEEAFILVYAAEFSRRKNQRFLIENLPYLPEDVCLLLPGGGDGPELCRKLAERLGVGDRVFTPGLLPDTVECLRAADVCVSSSASEGLPFHVMEAMSAGLPSILSEVKGHTDLIRKNRAGILFPPEDGDAFCRAVQLLRDDPGERASMGKNALEASARYDIEQVLPQVVPYYRP